MGFFTRDIVLPVVITCTIISICFTLIKVLPSFTEQVWVVPNLIGAKQLEEEIVPSARRPRREREGGMGMGREGGSPLIRASSSFSGTSYAP